MVLVRRKNILLSAITSHGKDNHSIKKKWSKPGYLWGFFPLCTSSNNYLHKMYLLEVPRLSRAWTGDATVTWWLSAPVLVWQKHELPHVSGVNRFQFQIFLNNSLSRYTYFELLSFSVETIFQRNIWANIAVPRLIPHYLCLENIEIVFIWCSLMWQALEKARVLYSTAWFHVFSSWKLLSIEN